MRDNTVIGIIFSNMHDEALSELTEKRTFASVPFGGRYRLIDFALSNMVNSGIRTIGIITKSNYRSLMDHVGSGKEWDLTRKTGGLFILPPFGDANHGIYRGRLEALFGVYEFLLRSKEKYVLMCDCDVIFNFDVNDLLEAHINSGAQVTVTCKSMFLRKEECPRANVLKTDDRGRVKEILLHPKDEGEYLLDLNISIMEKKFLEQLISDGMSKGHVSLARDVFQKNLDKIDMRGYKIPGYSEKIMSIRGYYEASMNLIDPQNSRQLFLPDRPIYTKVRDNVPALYGLSSIVKNSLVADGCVIEGEVENCVLFRGVHIEKGARAENSIIMQGSRIERDAHVNFVIADKEVTVKASRMLMGYESYPVYIRKGSRV